MRDRFSVDRSVFRFLRSTFQRNLTSKIPARRKLAFDVLEERTLLTAVGWNDATDGETLLASELSVAEDRFAIELEVVESGAARYSTQTGVRYSTSTTYCAVTDPIYLELLDRALTRWEEAIAVGLPDVEGVPCASKDGDEMSRNVDDIYITFGFSDSYASASAGLGSAYDYAWRRDGGEGLPATGSLVFNAKYFTANPSETVQNVFYNTALHELGHALGYNLTTLKAEGLVVSSSDAPLALDALFNDRDYWVYVGENGVENWLATYPTELTDRSSQGFAMETASASGTFGTHPSAVYGTFYANIGGRDGMTYSISTSYEATISAVTLGVLEDLGYSVDYDFADSINSPVPTSLTAEVSGASVRLSWKKSTGDFAANVSSAAPATYTVERRDATDENSVWTTIATGVDGTSYVDAAVEPGASYRYRVVANDVFSAVDVGLFEASAGERFSWDSDGVMFQVYALVGNGSNGVVWKSQGTTGEGSWKANSFSAAPGTGATLYRVVEIGAVVDSTSPSRAITVEIAADADEHVPAGYSATDWNALKQFLETTDSQGVKNGKKISAQYGAGFLDELPGVVWKTDATGVKRATTVSWPNCGLIGSLDLSGLNALERLDVSGNALIGLTLDSLALTQLNVENNALTTLDLANVAALESLRCGTNSLSEIDLSQNVALIYCDVAFNVLTTLDLNAAKGLTTLKCAGNALETLDLRLNGSLRTVSLWNAELLEVDLPQDFSGVVDLSDAQTLEMNEFATVRWQDANGGALGVGFARAFDEKSATALIETSDGATSQRIVFNVEQPLVLAAPTDWRVGVYANGRLETSWNDAAVGEVGYKAYYRVGDGEWRLAATLASSETIAATSGNRIERVATSVRSGAVYSFKICAFAFDAAGNEILSEPLVATFDPGAAPPTIALIGAFGVGGTVAATVESGGTDATQVAEYQWFRVDAAGRETAIDGATEATYRPTDAEVGFRLRVEARVANSVVSTVSSCNVVDAETLPKAPSDFRFGEFIDGRLETSWRDEAVNEDGYKVYYRVDGGEWRLAATLKSSESISATSGNIVERVATSVRPESVYSFKVVAFVVDASGNEIESTPLEATWRADAETSQLAAPQAFASGEYDAVKRTLALSWGAVEGAVLYEVEYRDSSDGGATWRRDWTLAQQTSATERTATA
ncbi:MAG: hypothetical protein IKW13_00970, partial [Thermoguttaceae bacterium]|nr:hypothetical protein [Thermoguttaceae bacterium]